MKFDLSALKAWVGMALATYGAVIAAYITDFVVGLLPFAVSGELKTALTTLVAAVVGYIAVYFTPNIQKQAS